MRAYCVVLALVGGLALGTCPIPDRAAAQSNQGAPNSATAQTRSTLQTQYPNSAGGVVPFGPTFYGDDPASLPETLHNQIRAFRAAVVSYQDGRYCNLFRSFFRGDNFAYVEGYLTELATYIGTFSADGGRRAAEEVSRFIRELGSIERAGCPRVSAIRNTNANRQNTPSGNAPPRRVLTGDELRRVLPNVAISRDHVFADPGIGRQFVRSRQKMRDGISRCDRALYDEGAAELRALFETFERSVATLVETPLDTQVETRESKNKRLRELFADGIYIRDSLSDLKFPDNCPRQAGIDIGLGGGGAKIGIPEVKGGTRASGGGEVPIAQSKSNFTGVTAAFTARFPVSNGIAAPTAVDRFILGFDATDFEGTATGSVPNGAATVAQTYLFPNPASGSTGINAGATGQSVNIVTDGRIINIMVGVEKDFPTIFPPFPSSSPFPTPSPFQQHTTIQGGIRYQNIHITNTITQQSLTFPDLNSVIQLEQTSHFIGPQIGMGVAFSPLGNEPGPIIKLEAHVAPGIMFTSARATQNSICGPCGAMTERSVFLQRDFDTSRFAYIFGGSIEAQFNVANDTQFFVRFMAEAFNDMPFFQVPTTPSQQPIGLGSDNSYRALFMAGFTGRLAFR